MDIIISAPQGAGKTQTAIALIKAHLGVTNYADIEQDVLVLTQPGAVGDNASRLAQRFREAKPEAFLFDGSITTPDEMLIAVAAVKKYREQTGRRTLAVYVNDGSAVVLTNGTGITPAVNSFREEAPRLESINTLRSVKILKELANLITQRGGGDVIEEALRNMNAVNIDALTPDQCVTLHSQLIAML